MATARDEQLRTFLQSYGDLVITFDEEGRYVDVITHEPDLLYDPVDEVRGKPATEVLPDPLGRRFHELIQEAFQTGDVQTWEYELPVPRGDRWFQARFVPFADQHSGSAQVVGVIRDVTGRKQIEKQLQESNLRFRQLADHTDQHFWLVDADFENLVYANHSFLEIVEKILGDPDNREQYFQGYDSLREIYERSDGILDYIDRVDDLFEAFLAAFHPDDHPKVEDALDRLRAARPVQEDLRVQLADGEVRWVRQEAHPVTDENGDIYRIAGLAEDITEQKKTREELRRTNLRFRQLADHTDQHFWLVDADFDEFVYVNRAFKDYVGEYFEQSDDLAEALLPWVHPEDREDVLAAAERVVEEPITVTFRVGEDDPDVEWFELQAHPVLDDDGEVYRVAGIAQNITDRKRTQRQLEATERQYRCLVEQNLVGIYVIKEGRFDYVNPIMAEMLGYRQSDLIGRSPKDVIVQQDHDRLEGNVRGLLSGEMQEANNIYRVTTNQGQRRIVEAYGVPVTMDGEPAILGNLIDITERKQAQQALQESQERFEQLATNTDQHFWMVDAELEDVIYLNPAAESFWGDRYDATDHVLERFLELVHPEDRPEINDALERVYEQKVDVEYRIRSGDGDYEWFEGSAFPILDDKGEVYRIGGLASIITPRKQTEQALRESQERFEQLAENTEDFFWLVDVDYEEMIYSNRALREFWGDYFEDQDDLLEAFLDRVHPEDREKYAEMIRRNRRVSRQSQVDSADFQELDVEIRVLSPEDEYRWFRVTGFPIKDDAGEIYRVGGLASDITEQKRTEKALRQSQKQFDQFASNTDEHFWMVDVEEGEVLFLNDAARDFWGDYFEGDRDLVPSLRRAVHPEDRGRFDEAVRRVQEEHAEVEIRLQANGSKEYRWFALSGFPIRDQNGDVHRIGGLGSDITDRKRAEEALRENERRFRQMAENIEEVFWLSTVDKEVLYASPAFEEIWGMPLEDLYSDVENFFEVIHPEDRERVKRAVVNDQVTGDYDEVFRIRRPDDGETRWIHDRAFPVYDDEGNVYRLAGIAEDITERKRAQRQLRRRESYLSAITDSISEAFYLRTADFSEVLYVSPAFEEMTGIPVERAKEDPTCWLERVHPDDRERLEEALSRAEENDRMEFESEFRMVREPGSVRWLRATGQPVSLPDRDDPVVAGSLEDITEQKEARQELQHEATHDRLTGLPNRNLLMARTRQLLERSEERANWSFAVLFIDLDGFKAINDSLGHSTGDEVLTTVAERLEGNSRGEDFVARYGGDEFVVLADWTDTEDRAKRAARRLLDIIEQTVQIQGETFPLSASIGIVLPEQMQEPEHLIRNADIAMYEAKEKGQPYAVFQPSMHQDARTDFMLENDLRDAVGEDQLRLHYQPIIQLNPRRVAGVEALLRWEHPERGLLSPGAFIEVAEDSGLIVSMGRWVLRRACRQWNTWKENGVVTDDHFFTVNHSVQEFEEPDFYDSVESILSEENVYPSEVNLEMTESVMSKSGESISQLIDQLKTLGLQLCVDDFGTGYSSFSRFSQWPFQRLKIDRSFVLLLDDDPEKARLTRQMVEMAKIMDMEVIGEGVESEQQLNKLDAWGCQYVQGFYFSRPLPADEFEAFVSSF